MCILKIAKVRLLDACDLHVFHRQTLDRALGKSADVNAATRKRLGTNVAQNDVLCDRGAFIHGMLFVCLKGSHFFFVESVDINGAVLCDAWS